MNRTKMFLSSLLVVMLLVGLTLSVSGEVQKGKVVIAHRGASGYLPEHTFRWKWRDLRSDGYRSGA